MNDMVLSFHYLRYHYAYYVYLPPSARHKVPASCVIVLAVYSAGIAHEEGRLARVT